MFRWLPAKQNIPLTLAKTAKPMRRIRIKTNMTIPMIGPLADAESKKK
jgi:hypothetical protein